ncbi:MAG: metallophosphoesterase [Clostridia bacterium]|nr:metallophosphoesterase [Clostridia bacterium]
MWYAVISAVLAVVISGAVYISFRSADFSILKRIAGGRKWLARIIGFVILAALTFVLWLLWGMMNALICVVHLAVIWILCDFIAFLVRKISRKRKRRRSYRAGGAAIIICVVYLAVGWFLDHHVFVKYYEFETDKIDGDVRVVQIADSHIGATFHADKFEEYITDINELEPDAVVITGDFVDDDTTREDMLAGCDALGKLQTKYGVFFVYGNHDKGYYSESRRGWTGAEMESRLTDNGVTILNDEACLIDGRFYIVGRRDRSDGRESARLSASELMSEVDKSKYSIILDHQPADFDAEAESGADLVLCGHTHGGQFIPINYVGEWIGENDLRYGHERRQNTDFVVSSGISNWAFKFKTGCNSEYVVIDIKGK